MPSLLPKIQKGIIAVTTDGSGVMTVIIGEEIRSLIKIISSHNASRRRYGYIDEDTISFGAAIDFGRR